MVSRASRLGAVMLFLASTACGTSSSQVTSSDSALETAAAGDGGAPPQVAIDACADLTLDDDCTFTGRRGETVSGTCEDIPGGELACVPAGGAGCARGQGGSGGQGSGPGGQGPGGEHPGPPQEATSACASLAADAACRFTGRDGDTVEGTCKSPPDGTALACAPARGERQGPPAEAVDACASAAEDAPCRFTHGSDSVTGTCKSGPDHDTTKPLACAPARPPQP